MFRPGDHVIYDPRGFWEERSSTLVNGMTGVVTQSKEDVLEIKFDEPRPQGAPMLFATLPYNDTGFRLAEKIPQSEFLSLLGCDPYE